MPDTIDVNEAIDFSVGWGTESGASGDTQTPSVLYSCMVMGVGTWIAPATALDTTIAVQADLGADIFMWSGWGSIAAGTVAVVALTPGDDVINLKILMTLSTLADSWIVGLKARYSRMYV